MKNTIIFLVTGLILGYIIHQPSKNLGVIGDFDTKGLTDIKIQALIKEPNFQDAIYYSPEEWNNLTKIDIENQKKERFENWKKSVEEFSKATSSPVINEIP